MEHYFRLSYCGPSANGDCPGAIYENISSGHPVEHAIESESVQQRDNLALFRSHLPIISQAQRNSTRRRSNRNKEREPKLSQEQLFANAIRFHSRRTAFFSQDTSENPYIRNHHLLTKNRTLAYTSAFLISEHGPKAVLSVLRETKKKPHCAVSIKLFIPAGHESIVAHCSCDYLITQTKQIQPSCAHTKVIFNDDNFIKQFTRELRRRQEATDLSRGVFIIE